jgi:hypothetical protein
LIKNRDVQTKNIYFVLEKAATLESDNWTAIYNGTDFSTSLFSPDLFQFFYRVTAFFRASNATSDTVSPPSMREGRERGDIEGREGE